MVHKLNGNRKGKEKDNAKSKRANHQDKILAACFCMVNTKRGINFEQVCIGCFLDWLGIICVAGNRRQWRNLCGSLCGGAGSHEYRQQPNYHTCNNAWVTCTEKRHRTKVFRA